MNITDDIEVYKLVKLLQVFGDERNSDFLFNYWDKSNKLKYLPKFLGSSHPSVATDEIQYVIAMESLLESFVDTLKNFIIDRYCSKENLTLSMDATITQQCDNLIVELNNLQKISFDAGWVDLYKNSSEVIAKITTKIDRLISVYGTGKQFHFVTNVEPEDFISANAINLKRKVGKYFIIDKQAD
jgi:hypothetical protein